MIRRHFLAAPLVLAAGCSRRDSRVVVYCAPDREFAEGVFADFPPEAGTAATHAACLFAALGVDGAKAFFTQVKVNGVNLVAGNKQVAVEVAAGRFAVGTTDTDDALIEVQAGKPVAMLQIDEQFGTLFIP